MIGIITDITAARQVFVQDGDGKLFVGKFEDCVGFSPVMFIGGEVVFAVIGGTNMIMPNSIKIPSPSLTIENFKSISSSNSITTTDPVPKINDTGKIMKKIFGYLILSFIVVLLLKMCESNTSMDSKSISQSSSELKSSSSENIKLKNISDANDLVKYKEDQISPTGELAELFNLGSDRTNLQRSEALKKLKGKVIKWNLTVYEISAGSDDKYRVQTDSGFDVKRLDEKLRLFNNEVSTEIIVTAKSESDKNKMLSFKTGDKICIKGQLNGDTTFRLLKINPAILCTSE